MPPRRTGPAFRAANIQSTGSGSAAPFVVEGVDELARQLARIPNDVKKTVMRNALTYAARVVRTEVRARVPQRTRTLHWAIQSKVSIAKGTALVMITHGRGERRDAWYWHMVEYGTVRSRAQPFIRPGYDAWERRIVNEFERNLDKALANIAN